MKIQNLFIGSILTTTHNPSHLATINAGTTKRIPAQKNYNHFGSFCNHHRSLYDHSRRGVIILGYPWTVEKNIRWEWYPFMEFLLLSKSKKFYKFYATINRCKRTASGAGERRLQLHRKQRLDLVYFSTLSQPLLVYSQSIQRVYKKRSGSIREI